MKLWLLKLRISLVAVGKVLVIPRFAFIALVSAFLVLGMLLWVFNINLLVYIITNSNINISDKILFFLQSYASVFTNFNSVGAATLAIFAILMGINITLLVYALRGVGISLRKEGGKNGLSLFAAILGAGCAACGTSILAPVLTAAGAAASIGLTEAIGVIANAAGIALVLFSIYGLGKQIAGQQARARIL